MKVLNKRWGSTAGAIYVGRPTVWGNPFVIGVDGDRDEVVRAYEAYAREHFSDAELMELDGHDLVCWCAPLKCHGDVLVKLVEEIRGR